MRKRCLIILGLIAMLAIGCQQSPYIHAHLESINAEKRALEDQLYDLEYDYQQACRELAALRQQSGQGSSSSNAPPSVTPSRSRSSSPSRSKSSEVIPPMVDEGTLVEPRIELPPATDSPDSRMKPETLPGTPPPIPPSLDPRNSTKPRGPNSASPASATAGTRSLEPADPRVTHIFLNPLLTGGRDFDRHPGDDGIIVVVEPRNRDDAFVPLAGPITVVALDPTKGAEESRIVERWEIQANEVQKSLRNSATMRGIELRLPWSSAAPQTNRLQLHVRYITVDNRDLRSDRPLFLNLPGQFTQQWTPRAGSRSESIAGPLNVPQIPHEEQQHTTAAVEQASGTVPVQEAIAAPADQLGPATAPDAPLQSKRPEWRPTR